MSLPLAIATLLSNARQEIVVSQLISAGVGLLLGPGCILLSALPLDALPEYRITLFIGGLVVSLLLAGLYHETRRKLASTDRVIQALNDTPEEVGRIVTSKEKSGFSASFKMRVELKDGTAETLPISESDYNSLITYLRAKFPGVLKERPNKPVR
jgi:hypothetical protein